MKHLLVLLLMCPIISFAQKTAVKVSTTVLDYGEIEKGDDRVREFEVENASIDTLVILKMQVPSDEFSVRFSEKYVPPKGKAQVRVKYNPKKEGPFNVDLILHTSAHSIEIDAKGKTKYLEWADYTPCPDFERKAEARDKEFEVNFKVIDVKTEEPIDGAEITLVGKTRGEFTLTTDRKGGVVTIMPIDYYDIKASKKGYGKYEMESYINRRNKDFTLRLLKGENSHTVVMIGDRLSRKKAQEEVAEVVEEEDPEQAVVVKVELEAPPILDPLLETKPAVEKEGEKIDDFSIEEFRPNNVVFLIDVSTSMQKEERMVLLKESMVSLTNMLRPDDRLSIITYASTTDVVMSGEAVTDKEHIIDVIASLRGEGMTAGEAGMKKAYAVARRHQIPNGNNQVYLATDGAFNKGSEAITKLAKKEAEKGTYLSILSIRGSKWASNKMEIIAAAGKGDYLLIEDFSTASDELKGLVKSQAGR